MDCKICRRLAGCVKSIFLWVAKLPARFEAKLAAYLDVIPQVAFVASAFFLLLSLALITLFWERFDSTGRFSAANIFLLFFVIFFTVVGLCPKLNARFWTIFGGVIGVILWYASSG